MGWGQVRVDRAPSISPPSIRSTIAVVLERVAFCVVGAQVAHVVAVAWVRLAEGSRGWPTVLAMDNSLAVLLVVHLCSTCVMGGVIWFVQVVHYPLFATVGRDRFDEYEAEHTRRTSWVVGPFMAVEGVTALWIAASPGEIGYLLPLIGLLLLAVLHASTVFLQVPRHRLLSDGFDPETARALVLTNWIRTVAWSARAVLAGFMTVLAI